jgi:hypothetical protein
MTQDYKTTLHKIRQDKTGQDKAKQKQGKTKENKTTQCKHLFARHSPSKAESFEWLVTSLFASCGIGSSIYALRVINEESG